MSHSRSRVPLGTVLQQAGLVSSEQVQEALQEQVHSGIKVGKILATQGRIDSRTVEFFAESWAETLKEQPKKPIGQYFKQAALLDEQQIQAILAEQKTSPQKFGELAISKGWLKQKTVDFFLRYLKSSHQDEAEGPEISFPEDRRAFSQSKSAQKVKALDIQKLRSQKPAKGNRQPLNHSQKAHEGFWQIKRKLLKIEDADVSSERTLSRIIYWTGGQSWLTQELLSLYISNRQTLDDLPEEEQVDYLVQNKVISPNREQNFEQHFVKLKNRLLYNPKYKPQQLLGIYQRVLTESVNIIDSPLQQELLNMGLVVRQQEKLAVANPLYRLVFSSVWITQELYQQALVDKNSQTNQQNQASLPALPASNKQSAARPRIKNLLLILTLMALVAVFMQNIAKRMKVRLAFSRGNEFLKQKAFEPAIDYYNELLKIDSNYFQAWTNRGYALAGLQRYEEMRESCSTATIINPGAIYAWNCQGEALHNLKQFPRAIEAFNQAIALDKTDPIFFINKSESLSALGKHQESIEAVTEGIELLEKIEAIAGKDVVQGEFSVALTFLGNGHRNQKEFLKTLKAYERALTYAPQYFPAQIGKAIALVNIQHYQQAEYEFKKILTNVGLSDSQAAQTWLYLGKTYCKSAKISLGADAFARALQHSPDYEAAKTAQKSCL